MNAPRPTGAFHELRDDDVAVSLTDASGVLLHANEPFERSARLPRGTSDGLPRGALTHPAMPASISAIMRRRLLAGEPFSGYLLNLAGDGSRYSVFSTVVSVPAGYLAVQVKPASLQRLQETNRIYKSLAASEQELRNSGCERDEAAEIAASRLDQLLATIGLPEFEAQQRHALQHELSARAERSRCGAEAREESGGGTPEITGRLGATLLRAGELRLAFERLAAEQSGMAGETESNARALKQLRAELVVCAETKTRILELERTGGLAGALALPLRVWTQMQEIVGCHLVELMAMIDELSAAHAATRCNAALAALHSEALEAVAGEIFAADLAASAPGAGGDGSADAAEAACAASVRAIVPHLLAALRADLGRLQPGLASCAELAERAAKRIASVGSIVVIPLRLLLLWREDLQRESLDPRSAELALSAAASIERIGAALEQLGAACARWAARDIEFDPERKERLLCRIEAATAPREARR